MTPNEAKRLKVGDLVFSDVEQRNEGEVIEVGYCAVKIQWDDLGVGILGFDKMKNIHRHLKGKQDLTKAKPVVG